MSARRNKQRVLDYLTAISEGRRDDAMAAFAEDALWKHPPSLGNDGRLCYDNRARCNVHAKRLSRETGQGQGTRARSGKRVKWGR